MIYYNYNFNHIKFKFKNKELKFIIKFIINRNFITIQNKYLNFYFIIENYFKKFLTKA